MKKIQEDLLQKVNTKMHFEVVLVTPELAGQWLAKNEGNRKLRESRASGYARAILDGKWRLSHQAIGISDKGRLLDGQHRLRAIQLAGKAVPMAVAFDVSEEAFQVLDAGLPRAMYERLRKDRRHVSICSTLFRLLQSNGGAQNYETELVLESLGPALLQLDQVSRPVGPRNLIKSAPMEGAIALRIAEAMLDKDQDRIERIRSHVGFLRKGEVSMLPNILRSFYMQAAEGFRNSQALGIAPVTDRFARVWVAFDPEKENATGALQVRDHAAAFREARDVFRDITQGVFDQ